MNTEEFSNRFDVIANSYAMNLGFGNSTDALSFDEYEKSVFLTTAQKQLVIEWYNGLNRKSESFEASEELRRTLDRLVASKDCEIIQQRGSEDDVDGEQGSDETSGQDEKILALSEKSMFFLLPEDHMFTIFEQAKVVEPDCPVYGTIPVVPVTHDEYHSISMDPFRWNRDKRAFRVNITGDVVEIICWKEISNYIIRYIRKPKPIILVNLDESVAIENVTEVTECELHESIHEKILERAVSLAMASRSIGSK